MCIIYSSYIQHLTNKQRKTDYWKKHRWKWGTTKVGAFLSASVGSYVCSTPGQTAGGNGFRRRQRLRPARRRPQSRFRLLLTWKQAPTCTAARAAGIKWVFSGHLQSPDRIGPVSSRAGARSPDGPRPPSTNSAEKRCLAAEGLRGIPSSSLTEVWSAQTWTLGTLFTHIIVTCKTSL